MKNKIILELEKDFYKKMIFVFIIMIIISLSSFISLINAFPLQILPNGTLVESDYDIGTNVDIVLFNNSLYIIEAEEPEINYYNKTYINNTYINKTYINQTCFNCTNYYNETNYYNNTNYGYNQSYLDKFVTNSIFNTFKSSLNYATKDELNNSINLIDTINNLDKSHAHTGTGIIIVIMFFIELGTIIYILYKVREEE